MRVEPKTIGIAAITHNLYTGVFAFRFFFLNTD